mmetsp:Transcript_5666/g.14472  ORF Transcript_5666/g.14472 Transcript_5666/m.14472 type:complete len:84 (-) Transcript_5666:624-875(-)
MHPPLKVHKHPHCREKIEALINCHADNPVAKFWGVCNDVKVDLVKCFAEEKVIKRGENLKKARAEQERLRQRLEAQSQPTAAH